MSDYVKWVREGGGDRAPRRGEPAHETAHRQGRGVEHPPPPLREGCHPANAVQDLDHLDPLDELPYLDAAEGEEEVDPDQRALPERVSPWQAWPQWV